MLAERLFEGSRAAAGKLERRPIDFGCGDGWGGGDTDVGSAADGDGW
jgi:hypothetical protein